MRLRKVTATYPYAGLPPAHLKAALVEILALNVQAWRTRATIAGGRDQIRWQTGRPRAWTWAGCG